MLGLFGKPRDNSKFRLWLNDNFKRAKKSNKLSLEMLSFWILFGISKFNQYNPKKIDKESLEIIKHYQGDATIFEYGCYFINWLDFWLYCNMEKKREDIMHYFLGKFVQGFSTALQISNVGDIVNNRLELYARLVSEGDAEGKEFYVIDLIKRTRDMQLPVIHDFSNYQSIGVPGLIEEIWLKAKIKTYKKSFYPAFIEILKKYDNISS